MFSRLTHTAGDEQRELQEQIAAIDPTLNLATQGVEDIRDNEEEVDYIEGDSSTANTARALVRRERERRKKSQQLIKKFNRHGQLVLDSFSRFDRDDDDEAAVLVADQVARPVPADEMKAGDSNVPKRQALDEDTLESRRALFREKTVMHDLEFVSAIDSPVSSNLSRRSSSFLPDIIKDDPLDCEPSEKAKRAQIIRDELTAWNPGVILDATLSCNSRLSAAISKELFPNSSSRTFPPRQPSRDTSGVIVLDASEEDEALQQLKGQIRTVNELLQHFWTALQSDKPGINDKRSKIADALRKHQLRLEETLGNFSTVATIETAVSITLLALERALNTLRLRSHQLKRQS